MAHLAVRSLGQSVIFTPLLFRHEVNLFPDLGNTVISYFY